MKLFAGAAFAVLIASTAVSAAPVTANAPADVNPCRSIGERGAGAACYHSRPKAIAAAKRAPEAAADAKVKDPLEQMKLDEEKLSKRLQRICRGC